MSNEKLNELLEKAKSLLRNEVTEIAYITWISPLSIYSVDNNIITLTATNAIQKENIESRYIDLITNTFNYITNKNCNIVIKLEDELKNVKNYQNNKIFNSVTGLNPKYTFDTFVVGSNNKFAQAASMGVAESPGSTKYNPLFLYGGVGLGKTHLMHAIGNQILLSNPKSKILYITSETFTNQLINALKDQSMEKFREKYRNVDVLLIDDIQFIANKKSTQEEFFHTFNTLYDSGKQIVVSSDRPIKDIELLEERIQSRLEWGIIADISKPDYETRFAILRKKSQEESIIIDDEILSQIANKVDSNIRELEGILNKIVATASLTNSPITMEMSQKAIDDVSTQKDKVISPTYIQEIVSKYFDINQEDLKGQKRSNDVAFPRQIAMYLCRNVAQMSMPQIGRAFGNRDHSTVLYACNKIEEDIKENTNTKLIVESVKNLILK